MRAVRSPHCHNPSPIAGPTPDDGRPAGGAGALSSGLSSSARALPITGVKKVAKHAVSISMGQLFNARHAGLLELGGSRRGSATPPSEALMGHHGSP